MEKRKLRVGFITSNPLLKTGFSHNIKNLLPILYQSNKYEIFLLSQQTRSGDPHLSRMPWHSEGVFVNFDDNKMKDPGYQRFVSYGNTAVEGFVTRNKLDVCFHIEDIWSSNDDVYLKSDWFKHIKDNFVQWSTADSEPILPNFKKWAENCKNIWFWSSFAERCLREEDPDKYGHCKTMYGSIKSDNFYPLPTSDREQLRNKFGISKDQKVILYLGRNQLRKLFWSHMEALKEYKSKHEDCKVKLHFHCDWSEGWPLERIRDELGLSKDDVLATYCCKACGHWRVQPFDGEDLECEVCHNKKMHTAGVTSTINEQELNKIYNMADGSCSVFTSGGFEYTHAESLLAGIPLASVNYSCGEDFCRQKFVFEIKPTKNLTRECGTGFKKFVPDISSIVEFYEKINLMTDKERATIAHAGRTWALSNFEAKVIAGKLQEFIDSCGEIDWDAYEAKKKQLKNPSAEVRDVESDYGFVNQCYKNILNMHDMTEDKEEVKHWVNYINQNGSKADWKDRMVSTFRNIAAQKNAEANPTSLSDLLEEGDKKRVLLALKESLGDHIILTSLLPEIQKKYPDASIYVGCDQQYAEVYDFNPYVKAALPWLPEMDNEMRMVGFSDQKGLFDVYINVGVSTQKVLNYLSNEY